MVKRSKKASAEVCPDCGEVHTRCTGHKKVKNSPDGRLHPCMRHPMKTSGTGKCRMHGGQTPKGAANPNFKDGRRSKYQYMPANLVSRYETLVYDAIANLEESIKSQMVRETQLNEKKGTGESAEAWIKLKAAVSDYDQASHNPDPAAARAGQAKAFGMIRFITGEGLSESFLQRDIDQCHEMQRKLTESVTKCRKEIQETYTSEQWHMFLETVMRIIRNNVDSRQLNSIQTQLLAASQNQSEPRLLG